MNRRYLNNNTKFFYYFDENGVLYLPKLSQRIMPGESVAMLGALGTDTSSLYMRFNVLDPLHQQTEPTLSQTIRCVSRQGNLFLEYSALDNYLLAEKKIFPYSRAELSHICTQLKKKFGMTIDFNTPLKYLSVSECIIIDVLRAYIANPSVLVCDNLFSLLEDKDRKIFMHITQNLVENQGILLYLTTKWESAVQVSSRIAIFSENILLGEADTQSVKQNPQHLIYLISGKDLKRQYENSTQKAEMLSMLYAGAEYLTDNMELRDAFSFILKNAIRLIGCSACSIHLSDEKDETLHLFSYPDTPTSPCLLEKFVHNCMLPKMAESLYYLNNEDINFLSVFQVPPNNISAFMCMPIVFNATVKGLFSVYFSTSVVYDEEQYLYLKSLCKETAIIIETSRLLGNSVLLQESNHRIKNNLQIIINLISMQKLYASQNPNTSLENILDSVIDRVQTIASTHEILLAKDSSISSTDLKKMLTRIIDSTRYRDIAIQIHCDNILIPYAKAASISMVVSELITNSLKYAFPDNPKDAAIHIQCTTEYGGVLTIAVRDNGVGFDTSMTDFNHPSSIGFSIIRTIVKMELGGKFEIHSSEHGTNAVFTVSLL